MAFFIFWEIFGLFALLGLVFSRKVLDELVLTSKFFPPLGNKPELYLVCSLQIG